MKVSLTPVNAVFCNIEMLRAMSQLAEKHNLHIQVRGNCVLFSSHFFMNYSNCHQTHTSETLDEIKIMRTWFKDYQTYTEAYDATGLLTNKVKFEYSIWFIQFNP